MTDNRAALALIFAGLFIAVFVSAVVVQYGPRETYNGIVSPKEPACDKADTIVSANSTDAACVRWAPLTAGAFWFTVLSGGVIFLSGVKRLD